MVSLDKWGNLGIVRNSDSLSQSCGDRNECSRNWSMHKRRVQCKYPEASKASLQRSSDGSGETRISCR